MDGTVKHASTKQFRQRNIHFDIKSNKYISLNTKFEE